MRPSSENARVVLYVDDEEPNRLLMSRLFSRYRPADTLVCVSSAQEALEQARERAPHLVLLDLTLPDRSGEDVLGDLKSEHRVPVVILSGHGDEGTRRRLLERGADGYVSKPLEVTELFATIEALIGSPADSQE